jgi:hypothetical protein
MKTWLLLWAGLPGIALAQQTNPPGDIFVSGSSAPVAPAQALRKLYQAAAEITADPSSGYRTPKNDQPDWPSTTAAQKGWFASMAAFGNGLTQQERGAYVPCAARLNAAIDDMERGYRIQISQTGNANAQKTVQRLYQNGRAEFAACPGDIFVSGGGPGNPTGGGVPGGGVPGGGIPTGGGPTRGDPSGGQPLPSPSQPSPGPPSQAPQPKSASPNAPPSSCSFTLTIKNNLPRNHPIWSGPWWPDNPQNSPKLYEKIGGVYYNGFAPLAKFDQWTGTQYSTWERGHHGQPSAATAGWQGHCDGWSVSSILYREPIRAVVATNRRSSQQVRFEFYDVKGLLAALWNGYSWDKNSAGGIKTKADLHALDFHKFLLFYLKENKEALVVNLTEEFGAVWNFPCDGFTMTGTPDATTPGRCKIKVKLNCAGDGVDETFLGKQQYVNDKTTTVSYSYMGKNPQSSNDPGSSADWDNPELHPWWTFCPIFNTSGSPSPPSGTNFRHHPYADDSFRKLVEGLQAVASGASNSWSSGDLSVTVAGKP